MAAPLTDGRAHTLPTSIFYNIFVPNSSKRALEQAGVIAEQLSPLQQQAHLASVPVYYTFSGAVPPFTMPCGNTSKCVRLGNQHGDGEPNTLTHLFEHCRTRPSERVVYLHNKGSLHASRANRDLRQALTKAALSIDCTAGRRSSGASGCAVCGFEFRPQPQPAIPGNMWSADCSYIATLIPPRTFASRQALHVQLAQAQWFKRGAHARGRADKLAWQLNRSSWTAADRTAAEYWVLSHPNATPCDVRGSTALRTYREPAGYFTPVNRSWQTWRLTALQRVSATNPAIRLRVKRLHPFFGLEERLRQWQSLYNQTPGPHSWVWPFFRRTGPSA